MKRKVRSAKGKPGPVPIAETPTGKLILTLIGEGRPDAEILSRIAPGSRPSPATMKRLRRSVREAASAEFNRATRLHTAAADRLAAAKGVIEREALPGATLLAPTAVAVGARFRDAEASAQELQRMLDESEARGRRIEPLLAACEEWLRGPDGKFDLGLRTSEVAIDVYEVWEGADGSPRERKVERTKLSVLLEIARKALPANHEPRLIESKVADPRKLLVDVAAELRQAEAQRGETVERIGKFLKQIGASPSEATMAAFLVQMAASQFYELPRVKALYDLVAGFLADEESHAPGISERFRAALAGDAPAISASGSVR